MKKITKIKRPYITTMNEVTITREDETAHIEYKEQGVGGVYLKIGKKIHEMSDNDILDCHNDNIAAQLELTRDYKYVATEITPGKPQVEYFEKGFYWTPRGGVLRCEVSCDDNGKTAVIIDDQEFSMNEFGKMLSTYEGWGMRIIFVPEDEIYKNPPIEIKDSSENKMGSLMITDSASEMIDN